MSGEVDGRWSIVYGLWTTDCYSCLNESTGLILAAFIVWKLTVEIATNNTANPAITKTVIEIVVRYGKLAIQLFIPSHTNGQATAIAMSTRLTYSFESKIKIPCSLDPNTFLMPISLVRCETV